MTTHEAIFQALPCPALIFDRQGRLESANPAALDLLWARSVLGVGLELQSVPELVEEARSFARSQDAERTRELELLTRAGPRAIRIVLRRISKEQDAGFLATLQAVSDVQRELGRPADDAWSLDAVDALGQRVRSSMQGVLGLTGLLAATALDAEQAEVVRSIAASAESLITLVEDWRDRTRMEGPLSENRPFSLRGVVEEAMNEARARTDHRGVSILAEVAPDAPQVLTGDVRHFRQALVNLVSRMAEEVPASPIRVRVGGQQRAGGAFVVHGTISGQGVSAADLEPSVHSTLLASTRLAAWFSRKTIEKMGGSVWVEIDSGGTPVCHFRLGFRCFSAGGRVEAVDYDLGATLESSILEPAIFDYDDALDMLDGEEDLLQQVAEVFLEDCPHTMSEIGAALERRDLESVAMSAHRLRGALGTLAAHPAHAATGRLERAALDGDPAAIGQAWADLRSDVDRLLPALREHFRSL